MTKERDSYFDALCSTIKMRGFTKTSYRKLLHKLYMTPYYYSNPYDENRALDGLSIRWRFGDGHIMYGQSCCTMLEMMIALAIRCEDQIMSDADYGDRTAKWFWKMVESLGLIDMKNDNYSERQVSDIINRFMSGDYLKNGKGGLFTVDHPSYDLRCMEIWDQMNLYLMENYDFRLNRM